MKERISREQFLNLVNSKMMQIPECEGTTLRSLKSDGEAIFAGPGGKECVIAVDRLIRELRDGYEIY